MVACLPSILCVCVWIYACNLHPSSLPLARLQHVFVCGEYVISDRFCSAGRLCSPLPHCSGWQAVRVVATCPWVLRHWNAGYYLSFSLLFCLLFCHHWLFSSVLSGVCSLALSLGVCSCVLCLSCVHASPVTVSDPQPRSATVDSGRAHVDCPFSSSFTLFPLSYRVSSTFQHSLQEACKWGFCFAYEPTTHLC